MIPSDLLSKLRKNGPVGLAMAAGRLISRRATRAYHLQRVRNAPRYENPTLQELLAIEQSLAASGVRVHDYSPDPDTFVSFQAAQYFPSEYHGGIHGPVWDEKLLEHWIAADRLGLMSYSPTDIYLDVAAANSPWAQALRERHEIPAFAIDLGEIGEAYRQCTYYRSEDASATSFAGASVSGASLHCAYEMFMGEDDTDLIVEMARILKPGGKLVILPLYMHTHYCAYSTPEYFGKRHSDPDATEYVRLDCVGIPSSRKYDTGHLKTRVLDTVERVGMSYKLLALRNKSALGKNIYCHFILEITR